MDFEEKATVSSLARDLGLSTCTVSKILNRSFDGFTYAAETIRRSACKSIGEGLRGRASEAVAQRFELKFSEKRLMQIEF